MSTAIPTLPNIPQGSDQSWLETVQFPAKIILSTPHPESQKSLVFEVRTINDWSDIRPVEYHYVIYIENQYQVFTLEQFQYNLIVDHGFQGILDDQYTDRQLMYYVTALQAMFCLPVGSSAFNNRLNSLSDLSDFTPTQINILWNGYKLIQNIQHQLNPFPVRQIINNNCTFNGR